MLKKGLAFGVTTQITQGANWIVHTREGFTLGDTLYSHGGTFTDCNLDPPHYHFGAGEMKYIGKDVIVARNVTFNFRDVPVFWLPFFVQSTKSGRRSGILMPQFGVNDIARTNAGYQRRIDNVGFYWAISDYMGAQLAMSWQSQNYTSLSGTFDYRLLRQFLSGSATYRSYWQSEGGRNYTIAANTDWQPDERTRLAGDLSYATSTQFIRTRSIDPRELNQSITSNVGFNRRFNFGSLNLSGQRQQQISDNTVTQTLPTLSLNLAPVTLFAALPGSAKWYNNATWNGSASGNYRTRSIGSGNTNPATQSENQLQGSASSTFTLGKFGWSQGVTYSDIQDIERMVTVDTVARVLPARSTRMMTWNAGLNYQQRLMGTTTFTPGLSLAGQVLQSDTTGGDRVAAPTRLNFNAALRTDLFHFYPGLGLFERVRHRISPSFSYTYSPSPTITERQRQAFGPLNIQEQNRLTIGVSQTFEAKPKQKQNPDSTGVAGADSTRTAPPDTSTGPKRRQRVQPITILSLSTDAVVYDFVQAKDGFGVQTTEIGNNVQSDLLRGLQLSFAHDLFQEHRDSTNKLISRDFKPHLSRFNAAFSVNSDSWLARMLGLGHRKPPTPQKQTQTAPGVPGTAADSAREAELARQQQNTQNFGLIGANRPGGAPQQPSGSWNASLNYTLSRPRNATAGSTTQMVTGNFSLQPTAQWAMQWSTGYSFTNHSFTDHILTLTRSMHDWDANFDFVKAQNGNFSFQFRAQLRANPDIKVDYSQRDLPRFNNQTIR